VDDPRLDCAMLRPMEADGDHFLTYYLTKDDESAAEFKARRLRGRIDVDDDTVRPSPLFLSLTARQMI
jgi:RNA polymerase II-associated factor 1